MHQVPLGIEAGPGLSDKTQDHGGGRVQEPSGMDGAGPKMQELSDPPKLLNAPLKEKAGEKIKKKTSGGLQGSASFVAISESHPLWFQEIPARCDHIPGQSQDS